MEIIFIYVAGGAVSLAIILFTKECIMGSTAKEEKGDASFSAVTTKED